MDGRTPLALYDHAMLTMGSLFDGIGGFPLAAVRNGIVPVWASEIEPFPIRVTQKHFPNMIHVGDITRLDGAKLPPVDIVCGGSPCQDLSPSGHRLRGLALSGSERGWDQERSRRGPLRPVYGTSTHRKGAESGRCTTRTDRRVYSTEIPMLGKRPRRLQLGHAQGGGLPDRPRGDL